MTDRPVIFSAPMVRSLIAGSKTMTRRALKPQPLQTSRGYFRPFPADKPHEWRCVAENGTLVDIQKVRYAPGDRLWVREAWRVSKTQDAVKPLLLHPRQMTVLFEAGGSMGGVTAAPKDGSVRPASEYQHDPEYPRERPDWAGRRRPSMFMPRWASRLTLTVTGVKVERLQEISEEDARAEGGPFDHNGNHYDAPPPSVDSWQGYGRASFCLLWNSIHGPGSWEANPFVVAIAFTVEKRNIDAVTP